MNTVPISYSNKLFYLLILTVGFISCSSGNNHDEHLEEQRLPLSDFNIYRGNTHSHTIFTWTHGSHRTAGMTDLADPTEFHSEWDVPPGMDWKDHNSISLNPEDYSNRQGLPANHLEQAVANGYDFFVITDHSQEPTLQPVSADNPVWKTILKSVEEYDDNPNFVALAGFEYSRNTPENDGSGHINPINVSEYVNPDHGQRGPAPSWPEANWSIPQFYDWIKTVPPHGDEGHVVATFNHPGLNQYNDWDNLDDEIVNIITMFEMHSGYREIRWNPFIRALNKGWKVSPIGVLDNHSTDYIVESPPPTSVLATELTKEAITRAMSQRRTFVSWNEDVELRYAVNDFIMGSTLDTTDIYNFDIKISTNPEKPEEGVRRIQILRDHPGGGDEVEVVEEMLFDGDMDSIVWAPVIEDSNAKYFLLRIHHTNDIAEDGGFNVHGSTISAPVWTGR